MVMAAVSDLKLVLSSLSQPLTYFCIVMQMLLSFPLKKSPIGRHSIF